MFFDKDELYLACVEECFQHLTKHLQAALIAEQGTVEEQLERYFSARVNFFQTYPVYQPIFCEAVISPPSHLLPEIQNRRQAFDHLTTDTLARLLRSLPLRPHITIDEVIETFREFQDFINAKYHFSFLSNEEFRMRDEYCRKILNTLLYGVIERRKN